MANNKPRMPMQVSDAFEKKLKELQKKIRMKTGENPSLRDITEDIVKFAYFEEFEKKLLNGDMEINLKIKMDGRRIR